MGKSDQFLGSHLLLHPIMKWDMLERYESFIGIHQRDLTYSQPVAMLEASWQHLYSPADSSHMLLVRLGQ